MADIAEIDIEEVIDRPRVVRSGAVEWARTVLRADAAVCGLSGAVLIGAASPLATLVTHEPVGAVRVAGIAMLVVAADLMLLSVVGADRVTTAARAAAGLNLAWVGATVATVAAGVFRPGGALAALAGAVAAGAFAWQELVAAGATGRSRALAERITTTT